MTAAQYRRQFTAREWRLLSRSPQFVRLVRARRYTRASGLATILFMEHAAQR
jgi:hypothetical protein